MNGLQTVLEVADACSGLRSLMSLVTLAVALAFITQKSSIKRTIIIVSAVPVAIMTNMFRVITTGVLASYLALTLAYSMMALLLWPPLTVE